METMKELTHFWRDVFLTEPYPTHCDHPVHVALLRHPLYRTPNLGLDPSASRCLDHLEHQILVPLNSRSTVSWGLGDTATARELEGS